MTQTFTPLGPLKTAVLLLVFNRPDTTAQVFEAIRNAAPPRLYVAADGPRQGRKGEAERVAKVVKIATAVDWPCELNTLLREHNIGCRSAVSSAITWFFKHEEQGIILEDDCLPCQSFFWYCEEMLHRYVTNEKVMAITGVNIARDLNIKTDYFFSNYPLMWGWASWRRGWEKYDAELADWPLLRRTKWLRTLDMGGRPFEWIWTSIFDRVYTHGVRADTWDYQWIYSCWRNDGLTIAPRKNLIRNIGHGPQATHTQGYHPILSNLAHNELEWPLNHPHGYQLHPDVEQIISKVWFGVSWLTMVKIGLLKIPGLRIANAYRKKMLK